MYIAFGEFRKVLMTDELNRQKGALSSIEVVDLFCGIGGLSYGMRSEGVDVKGGFDIDLTCRFAYEFNNHAPFIHKNIVDVIKEDVVKLYSKDSIKVLAGCAPCQPFSSYAFKNKEKDSSKYDLLYEFGRLIKGVRPDIVTMENVPSIFVFKKKPVFHDFVAMLKREGYNVFKKVVFCPEYGIPQTRRRLVLLASKFGEIEIIPPIYTKENYVTVQQTIGMLEPLQAGESSLVDPVHRCSALSQLNLCRIKATPPEGGWKDWPEELRLNCHRAKTGKSFGSVYGRMSWSRPAPTMTTQCTSLGSGRFGHPTQDRAISAREAALFQTFPNTYRFFENEKEFSLTVISRHIGNAVPPKLGAVIAKSIILHCETYHK